MKPMKLALTALAGIACVGCGASDYPAAGPAAPHGGEMFALPDDLGWVELRNEEEKPVGKMRHGAIVAYFFKTDRQTPLDAAPTDVKIAVADARGHTETVPLEPSPASDGADPASRFASKVGSAVLSDLPGELSGRLGPTPFTVKFRTRR